MDGGAVFGMLPGSCRQDISQGEPLGGRKVGTLYLEARWFAMKETRSRMGGGDLLTLWGCLIKVGS